MARYQILYWQDLPAQVRAEDADGEVQVELGPRFQGRIDAVATERGAVGTDDYLLGWRWGGTIERPGTAGEVAEAVRRELEASFPGAGEPVPPR